MVSLVLNSIQCNEDEDQERIFMCCEPINKKLISKNVKYGDIFKEIDKQKETVEHLKIEEERIKATEALLPGGGGGDQANKMQQMLFCSGS